MPTKPGKHLDSPSFELANKSQDDAYQLDDASRRAFNNLIALGIEEECRLIVIAGMQMATKLGTMTKRILISLRDACESPAMHPAGPSAIAEN